MSRTTSSSRRLTEHKERSESPRSTNYYFSNLTDSTIIKDQDENSAFKFIVLQNDSLHERNETLTKLNKDLENQVEELEDDRDNLEKQRLALRGYLKNEIELQKLYQELNSNYKLVYEFYKNKCYRERTIWIIGCLLVFPLILIPLYVNPIIPNDTNTLMYKKYLIGYKVYLSGILMYIIGIIINFNKIIKYTDIKQTNATVIKLRKQINDTIKGNELLDQLVDGL